jgi:hypothetical protein
MKRHEIDVVSFVSGLLFTTLAVVFTLNALGTVSFDIRVVPAAVLIVLGIAGISAAAVNTNRTSEPAAVLGAADSQHLSDRDSDPGPGPTDGE